MARTLQGSNIHLFNAPSCSVVTFRATALNQTLKQIMTLTSEGTMSTNMKQTLIT